MVASARAPGLKLDHERLRRELFRLQRARKIVNAQAAEMANIELGRYAALARGYHTGQRSRAVRFTLSEAMGICSAFDLDIWQFMVLPASAAGSSAEMRDRAWAECHLAWQYIAELKQLLKTSLSRALTREERARAEKLIRTAGPT